MAGWSDANCQSAGTMTLQEIRKFYAKHADRNIFLEENSSDIATAEEIIALSESINQQLASSWTRRKSTQRVVAHSYKSTAKHFKMI